MQGSVPTSEDPIINMQGYRTNMSWSVPYHAQFCSITGNHLFQTDLICCTFYQKKSALYSFDDKSFLVGDGKNSIGYGDRDIPSNIQEVELVGDKAGLIWMEQA